MLNQININDIVTIAKEAGNAIMEIYKKNFEVEYKPDCSPITIADKKANNIIENGLNRLFLNLPILSEEGEEITFEDRKHWEYFWLVDPLDGTKEFIKKNGEFTVNIALIRRDTPVLGVVYAPALDICYWAKQNEGAFKDKQKLPHKTKNQRNTFKIVASRSHKSVKTQAFIDAINTNKKKEVVTIGSSLKICIVAEGEADIYPRFSPTMEWDTGAAHAILSEAGGKIIDQESNDELKYNKDERLLNNNFIVLN
jgi:3'(2'), 5'-bisphosphate nucleotidase